VIQGRQSSVAALTLICVGKRPQAIRSTGGKKKPPMTNLAMMDSVQRRPFYSSGYASTKESIRSGGDDSRYAALKREWRVLPELPVLVPQNSDRCRNCPRPTQDLSNKISAKIGRYIRLPAIANQRASAPIPARTK
jgi:hypothetical protein